jgi:hypothetical protein
MEYFEDGIWGPKGNGRCGEEDCPCGGAEIPRGEGYLYVSRQIVEFRRRFRSHQEAVEQMDRLVREKYGRPVSYAMRIGPTLLCRRAAKAKGIDLDIAAADAKLWWVSGNVPLRATPMAGSGLAKEEKRRWR